MRLFISTSFAITILFSAVQAFACFPGGNSYSGGYKSSNYIATIEVKEYIGENKILFDVIETWKGIAPEQVTAEISYYGGCGHYSNIKAPEIGEKILYFNRFDRPNSINLAGENDRSKLYRNLGYIESDLKKLNLYKQETRIVKEMVQHVQNHPSTPKEIIKFYISKYDYALAEHALNEWLKQLKKTKESLDPYYIEYGELLYQKSMKHKYFRTPEPKDLTNKIENVKSTLGNIKTPSAKQILRNLESLAEINHSRTLPEREKTSDIIERIVKLNPSSFDLKLLQATYYRLNSDYDMAEKFLIEAKPIIWLSSEERQKHSLEQARLIYDRYKLKHTSRHKPTPEEIAKNKSQLLKAANNIASINTKEAKHLSAHLYLEAQSSAPANSTIYSDIKFNNIKKKELTLQGVQSHGLHISNSSFALNIKSSKLNNASFEASDFASPPKQKGQVKNSQFHSFSFKKSRLKHMVFTDTLFSDSHFLDSTIIAEFKNVDFGNSRFHNIEFKKHSRTLSMLGFSNVDFSKAEFSNVTFDKIYYDCKTQWPENFNPIRAGLKPLRKDCSSKVFTPLDFTSKRFAETDFQSYNLINSNFKRSKIFNSSFNNAEIKGANFSDSEVANSTFKNADLRNVNFSNAQLRNNDFQGADLRGTDFFHVFMTLHSNKFKNAKYDETTKWHPLFDPIAAGAILVK